MRALLLILLTAALTAGCQSDPGAGDEGARPTSSSPASAGAALERAERLARADSTLAARLRPTSEGFRSSTEGLISEGFRQPKLGTFPTIGSRLDLGSAQAPWEVGLGRSERHRVKLFPVGAEAVAGRLEAGRVVYENAFTDTDLIYSSGAQHAQAFFVLRSASAPQVFGFRVELGKGLDQVRKTDQGELEFVDGGGTRRLAVGHAFALDAAGTRRDAELGAAGDRIAVSLDTRGLVFPVLLDPPVFPAIWEHIDPPNLTQRSSPAIAYDSARAEMLVIGGNDINWRTDTWAWNGTAWTRKATSGIPVITTPVAAYDPARSITALFQNTAQGLQTWEWNGSVWTGRAPSSMPPQMSNFRATAYGGKLLVTGVVSSAFQHWEWDGTAWTRRFPATLPTNTSNPYGLTTDTTRNRAVWGSYQGIWEWDGSNWTQLATNPFIAGAYVSAAYAGGATLFVSYSSAVTSTASWNGTVLSPLSPPTALPGRYDFAMAGDSARGVIVMFGGQDTSGFSSETWEWDTALATKTWRRAAPHQGPHGRYYTSLFYDPIREEVLVPGGINGHDEIWSYDGESWQLELENAALFCYSSTKAVWDSTNDRGVIVGCTFGGAGQTLFWDGQTSSLTATLPPPTALSELAFDAGRGLVVGRTTAGATYEFDGSDWTLRTPVHAPPIGTGSMAYDSAHGYVLYGYPGLETWSYDGDDWFEHLPGTSYVSYPRYLIDVPPRGRPIMVGNTTLYDWDGVTWHALPFEGSFQDLPYGSGVYDERRGRIVLYGDNTTNLIHELHTRGGVCDGVSDCETGHCVDGVCCEEPSCGTCQACNVSGSEGRCNFGVDLADPDSCATPNVCGPTGTCGKALGASCSAGSECASAFCADGVCCDRSCDGACNRCNLPNRLGTCTAAAAGDPGENPGCAPYACTGAETCPSSCTGNQQCFSDATVQGRCVGGVCTATRQDGQPCAAPSDCFSNNCVEGVCCDTACAGLCRSCLDTRTGIGDGNCGPLEDGTVCGTANCAGGSVTGQICVAGNCQQGSQLCAPFECDPVAGCATSCTVDGDCVANSRCVAGACTGVAANGLPCQRDSNCASGYCVEGVCCDEACSGTCQACAQNNKADGTPSGSCGQARVGVACGTTTCANGKLRGPLCNAAGTCVTSELLCVPYRCDDLGGACETSCATSPDCEIGFACSNGLCQGVLPLGAACPLSSYCASGHCSDGVCCDAECDAGCDRCDVPFELGTCQPRVAGEESRNPSCAPYLCNGSSATCPTTCDSSADCTGGLPCTSGVCARGPNGNSCQANGDCQSDYCVDGVCCDGPCTGCRACTAALTGLDADGECGPVIAGEDPHNTCETESQQSCGRDGMCDGVGRCRIYPRGASCGSDTRCEGNYAFGELCDGMGACIEAPATGQDCAPYVCLNGVCSYPCGACTFGTQCNPDSGRCEPLFDVGDACSGDFQCKKANCVDGFCCNSECRGSCEACNLDMPGECAPVPEGEAPRGGRRACSSGDPADALCDGACDGMGACAYPTDSCGSVCAAGRVTSSACDQGACVAAEAVTCGNYNCDVAGEMCHTSCVSEAECAAGFHCKESECVPKPSGECLSDSLLHVTVDDRDIQCIAYKCRVDRCLDACTGPDDCQAGFACDKDGLCVLTEAALAAATAKAEEDGCGCRLPGRRSSNGAAAALAALALAALRRRLAARFSAESARKRTSTVPRRS